MTVDSPERNLDVVLVDSPLELVFRIENPSDRTRWVAGYEWG
jgi:hypothetical protein